jgi:hypothetical protein
MAVHVQVDLDRGGVLPGWHRVTFDQPADALRLIEMYLTRAGDGLSLWDGQTMNNWFFPWRMVTGVRVEA